MPHALLHGSMHLTSPMPTNKQEARLFVMRANAHLGIHEYEAQEILYACYVAVCKDLHIQW